MKNTVEQIIRQYGSQILLDENRFAAIVGDLSPKEAEVERKVVRRLAQSHLLKDTYNNIYTSNADKDAGASKLVIRMNEEGFTREWCQIALTIFGLKTDSISSVYQTSADQQSDNEKEITNANSSSSSPTGQTVRSELDIFLSMAIDEIDGKEYGSAQKALQKALYEAPRDGRVLFLASVAFEGDKRALYAKRLGEAFSTPTEYELLTVGQSINKERYLHAFYSVKDKRRIQMCLEKGASPNMLYPELAYIVNDAGVHTADSVNYDSHDGYGTIFFCSVYEEDYELTELCLKAGATMYPEKVCKLDVMNAGNCANPSRCAVMSRLMRSNNLKMLQLIGSYIPEIANVEFASRTMHVAYQNEGRLEVDNEIGHADIYAGADQSPLSYCVEYDIGDFYDRPVPTCSLMGHNNMVPFDSVMKSGKVHRYLETAKWLIENGANLHRGCESIMFANGKPEPKYNVSLLSMAVDRGNLEMVQALLAPGTISKEDLNIAITWSTHNDVTNYLVQQGASAEKATSVKKAQEKSQKGGCYIATAVYGSYDCPEVWTLRRFRDQFLQCHILGRLFVRTYYAVSPTIVRLFKNARWFNVLNRKVLNAWVDRLQEEGYTGTPYQDP